MGWWQVDADTVARSRFVVSSYAEVFASLKLLHSGAGAHPGEVGWLRAHRPGYRALLAADPVARELVRVGLGREWIADFLTPTPRDGEGWEEALARVRGVSGEAARAHLRTAAGGGELPGVLARDDLGERAARVLEWVWEETVRPYWGRRRRVLEADVAARTAQVSEGGWAAVLDSLRPGTRWLGESRFQVNLHEYPPRDVSGAELVFVPVTPRAGWVSWEERERPGGGERERPGGGERERSGGGERGRFAVVYPCVGVLAGVEQGGAGAGGAALEALMGAGRARVLVLLGVPLTTTQLVAVTGMALGSVGRHLRVLLDAGLVERRRVGRAVRYSRTGVGDAVVGAGGR
ncbi:ArsR/SmtB family transcription factor [Streptomyces longwoodensis]|uniref:ArsR/SmtB family transcription factor n=1 Tax=Streptomyces longwoodensis TaxID=68231 RepID=UPI0036FDF9A3